MATINQTISDLRGLIKQVQDDSHYTDAMLFSLLNKAKSYLLRQKLLKYRKVSEFNWDTFCVNLELAKAHDCECVAVGCDVLASTFELPRVLSGNNMDLIRVETLGGKLIPKKTEEQLRYEKYDDIKSGQLAWSLRSRRIIIWNNLNLKTIQVSGVWEDISQWQSIDACADISGNPATCVDIYTTEFSIDNDLLLPTYQMVLKLLNIPTATTRRCYVRFKPKY
jgi:hypothetical protein